jgi:predicted RNA-binding protein with RPS1 domain
VRFLWNKNKVADNYVKNVNDHLKIGDMVEVKVISMKDVKTSLSIQKAVDPMDKLLLIHYAHHTREDLITE